MKCKQFSTVTAHGKGIPFTWNFQSLRRQTKHAVKMTTLVIE